MLLHAEIGESPPSEVPESCQSFIKDWIRKRISDVDPSEETQTLEMLDEIFNKWSRMEAREWGSMANREIDPDSLPLLAASGTNVPSCDEPPFMTPTSMRNVDATSKAFII
jgi:hypothetical protein